MNESEKNNYWSKENIRKRLREKSKENLVKRKHDQVISSNISNCVVSFLCCCLMLFNFHNSKTMLALFCVLVIGFIMILSSINIIKLNNEWLFLLNMIISMMLIVMIICNKQDFDSTDRGYYDSYMFKAVLDQCVNLAIVAIHSLYISNYKFWYIYLIFNVINLALVCFGLTWMIVIPLVILLGLFISRRIYVWNKGAKND